MSSTATFVVFSLATWNWHPPQTGTGWIALLVVSVTVTIAVLTLFISINRIGPFRSALIGIDKLGWRGATAAVVAFLGLALIVGAHPGAIAVAGLAFAFGTACLRTAVLLISRGALGGADSRLLT